MEVGSLPHSSMLALRHISGLEHCQFSSPCVENLEYYRAPSCKRELDRGEWIERIGEKIHRTRDQGQIVVNRRCSGTLQLDDLKSRVSTGKPEITSVDHGPVPITLTEALISQALFERIILGSLQAI